MASAAPKAGAGMTVSQPDLFHWRETFMSKRGPDKLGRHVLNALAMHMKPDGTGAWPSQILLAERTGMSIRSVKHYLQELERFGWIRRVRVAVPGKTWRRTEYTAAIPDTVEQGAPHAPSYQNKVQETAQQGAGDGKNKVRGMHTNSPSNYPYNSKSAASRSRRARSAAQEPDSRETFEGGYIRRFGCMPPIPGGSAAGRASVPDASPRATTTADLKSAVAGLASKMRAVP